MENICKFIDIGVFNEEEDVGVILWFSCLLNWTFLVEKSYQIQMRVFSYVLKHAWRGSLRRRRFFSVYKGKLNHIIGLKFSKWPNLEIHGFLLTVTLCHFRHFMQLILCYSYKMSMSCACCDGLQLIWISSLINWQTTTEITVS